MESQFIQQDSLSSKTSLLYIIYQFHCWQTSVTMEEMFKPAPAPKTDLGRYKVLSSTAGIRVSPLCFGAMSIGDAWTSFMGSMDKEQSFKLMDAYFDAGGNFIDTGSYHSLGDLSRVPDHLADVFD